MFIHNKTNSRDPAGFALRINETKELKYIYGFI
jgi:hypothetical protein